LTPVLTFWLPGVSILYIIAVLIAFWRGPGARINLSILTISCVVGIYMSEFLLITAGPHITLPSEFDRRSKLQVVLDLRKSGQNVVPSVHPKNLLASSFKVGDAEVVPLGGISQATTVFCNETGKYYIYDSDEFGFTNPLGLYSKSQTKVALIGDSFTQGFCAPFGASYAERIRASIPGTLNLGNNGNGPLLELAAVREFLIPIKPQYVFWFYFEGNDVEDLSREIANPVLARYLADSKFSQQLMEREPETDKALRAFVETSITTELNQGFVKGKLSAAAEGFRLWSRLWHIRALLGINDIKREWILHQWNQKSSEQQVQVALDQTLQQAKDLVEGWGGKFVVVYLPSYRTFGYRIQHPWRERVLELLNNKGIQTIDLLPTFEVAADPFALYNYRKEGHYTTLGNEVVADAVLDYLRKDGFQSVSTSMEPVQIAEKQNATR